MLLQFFLICIVIAFILLWFSSKQQLKSGLPGGRIISSDTSQWDKLEKPLYSPILGLTGKPDYVVEHAGTVIPVEVKSSSDPDRGPYDSHIFQLAAYCLLLTHEYGNRPDYGILHYTSKSGKYKTYSIPFTKELEAEVISMIEEIQTKQMRFEVHRSHQSASRCRQCGFRNACDQSKV